MNNGILIPGHGLVGAGGDTGRLLAVTADDGEPPHSFQIRALHGERLMIHPLTGHRMRLTPDAAIDLDYQFLHAFISIIRLYVAFPVSDPLP
jgi:hypothetical protein